MRCDDIVQAVYNDRRERLVGLLRVLENGEPVGVCLREVNHRDTDALRLRIIRDELVELDLYRLHFGPLPEEFNDR